MFFQLLLSQSVLIVTGGIVTLMGLSIIVLWG
jgi:hypothetical protein